MRKRMETKRGDWTQASVDRVAGWSATQCYLVHVLELDAEARWHRGSSRRSGRS